MGSCYSRGHRRSQPRSRPWAANREDIIVCNYRQCVLEDEPSKVTKQDPRPSSRLVTGNTMFALDMYQELCRAGTGNIFFSPISISMALAMTYLGAANNTATEMKQTLKLSDLSDEDLHEAYKDLNQVLNSDGQAYTLRTANCIFARKTDRFLEDFMNATKKYYSAEAKMLDFIRNAEQSRAFINKWVEEQTANKIKNLLGPGLISSDTVMVLVNAIYFKGEWMKKFNKSLTTNGKFKLGSGGTAHIQMCKGKFIMKFAYSKKLNCKVIEIPYVNEELSMIIILPNKDKGLPDLEKNINAKTLTKLTSEMGEVEVQLSLPRFKLEHSFSLKEILKALGMKDMFRADGTADFSKMEGTKGLYMSAVLHKAFIEVNEDGSEAAAASCVTESVDCADLPMVFNADHPFLFFIRENHTKGILFMGRLADPR